MEKQFSMLLIFWPGPIAPQPDVSPNGFPHVTEHGDTYEMMNEMERQCGEDENVQWFRSHISFRNIYYSRKLISRYNETSSLGSKNTLPVYLIECEEYKQALRRIPDKQTQFSDKYRITLQRINANYTNPRTRIC